MDKAFSTDFGEFIRVAFPEEMGRAFSRASDRLVAEFVAKRYADTPEFSNIRPEHVKSIMVSLRVGSNEWVQMMAESLVEMLEWNAPMSASQ